MAFKTIYRHRVEWGDCDGMAIVFYPNYFRWFDSASHLLFRSAGLDWTDLDARFGIPGLPLVDAQARFVLPSKFNDELAIESHVSEWHSKLLVVTHKVMNGDRLAVEGTEKRVWAGPHPDQPGRLKSHVIPDEIRDALS
ncbi:MAG: acyl-CoA thioesterase [Alphaproteobacteria bacterium]|nr:acyl-CoA thioesterase [Alphaproteobacteria bacterium]MCZ6764732.1 acyl-CoA thioesterase [Alphaproteobacteria bacterium]